MPVPAMEGYDAHLWSSWRLSRHYRNLNLTLIEAKKQFNPNISQTEKMFGTSSSSVKSVLPPRSLSAYAMNNSFIAFSLLEKIANKCSNAIKTKVFCLKRLTTNAITKRPASATHHSDDVVSPSRSDAHQDVFQPSCPILVRENTEGGSGEKNTNIDK